MVHPWVDGCAETNIRRFFDSFVRLRRDSEAGKLIHPKRFMLPVYSALHIIPLLVLRRQTVKREPLKMLLRVTWGITRSCSFLGAFVFIFHCQSPKDDGLSHIDLMQPFCALAPKHSAN